MGRHSAPDDEQAGLDERPADAAPATSVATVPWGRHSREDGARPRPMPEAEDDGSATGGLDLLEQAFDSPAATSPDPPEQNARLVDADEPTTKIALADLARHDRPLPEEVTAKIAPITDAPGPTDATEPAPPPAPDATEPADAIEPAPPPAPDATEPADAIEPAPPPAPAREGRADREGGGARGAHATRHDLALVMSHGDVRARVLAAVLGPFVVYVAVFAIIGKLMVHSLVWVWAPAIMAGVLVGLVLDAGHRRYPAPGEHAPADEVAPST